MNTPYRLIHNAYTHCEPASALAELRRTFGFSVHTMALNASEVVSMAGLRVMPDLSLGGFVPGSAAILILPGGDFWTQGELPEVSQAVCAVIAENRPVAAICAATLARALRLLDDRLHTTNGGEFIGQFVKSYHG